jgi:hypothetical protein
MKVRIVNKHHLVLLKSESSFNHESCSESEYKGPITVFFALKKKKSDKNSFKFVDFKTF